MYEADANIAVQENRIGLGLRTPEKMTDRLDRQIAEVEAHLEHLKNLRRLVAENPLLPEFHDALRKAGF